MKKKTVAMIAAGTMIASMVSVVSVYADSDTVTMTADTDVIYQVALLQSLTQGYYDGIVTVGELKQHGDTGIGTFEGVNGEMIVLDGVVYQVVADGSVVLPEFVH